MITLNYPVILSHRRSTTISLETYPRKSLFDFCCFNLLLNFFSDLLFPFQFKPQVQFLLRPSSHTWSKWFLAKKWNAVISWRCQVYFYFPSFWYFNVDLTRTRTWRTQQILAYKGKPNLPLAIEHLDCWLTFPISQIDSMLPCASCFM